METKSKLFSFRLSEKDLALIKRAAKKDGQKTGTWVRLLVVGAAKIGRKS
jgi:predicted DNA binding CopG/RHH family protein